MAGTIIVARGKSLDVRTIDFERIADALRRHGKGSEVSVKLLQSMDEFGMDMICADELNSAEFMDFFGLLDDVRAELNDSPGLIGFINQVRTLAQEDERFRR
ncbi:hypothetical protein ACS5PK_22365 [Roseateles sp. DB2]|uniref:hypothetical protein n=1 Tax=Roseateles sp. DB2 TaxID=3453717 RepID=UPI003EEEE7DE